MTSPRVLVVEDEGIVAHDVSEILRESGYDVVGIAASGEAAVEMAEETQPDLVLVDIKLKGEMDGIEVARRIRSTLDAAIVYLSAHSETDLFERAIETDPWGYLSKPVSSRDLTRTIEVALYGHTMRKKLRASEERFRRLAEATFEGVAIHENGVILEANQRFSQMFGYELSELIGMHGGALVDPETRDLVLKHIREGYEEPYEALGLTKGGSTFWGELNSRAVHYPGRTARVTAIRDITDRKNAEAALQYEKHRFETLVENSPLGLVLIGDDGKFEYINPKFTELFGYELGDVPDGRHWFRKAFPDTEYRHQVISAWIEDVKETAPGELRPRIFTVICKDGTEKIIEFRPVQLDTAEHLMTCEDITERDRAQKALEASERRFRTLVEAAKDVIWTLDMNLKYTYVSPAITDLLGYTVEEIMSLNPPDTLTPSSRQRALKVVSEELAREARNPGSSSTVRFDDIEQYRKDGSTAWVELTTTLLRDDAGKPSGIIGISHNISHRKKAEEALQKAHDELEQRVEERTAELRKTNEELKKEIAIRREAERALRKSEERYRDLFQNAKDIVYTRDLQGNVTSINRAGQRLLGYSPEETMNLNVRDIVDPQYLSVAADNMHKKAEGVLEKTGPYELLFRSKDGSPVWVEVNSRVMKEEGKPVGVHGIARNITDRKRVEEALRESEAKYRFLAEEMHDVVWTVDLNMNTTYASPSIERVLGFTPEERMAQTVTEQLTPESFERATRALMKELERDTEDGVALDRSLRLELDFYRKDGSTTCLETVLSFIRDQNSKPVGVYGLSRDITDRKQAEEALRESEERYRTIIENIEDSYFEADLKGNMVFFNDAACQLLGYTRDELVGMNYHQYMDERQARTVFEICNSVYKTGEPGRLSGWQMIRKDGTRRTVETPVSLIHDANGDPCGFRGLGRDITERIRAEEAIRESEARYRAIVDNAQDCIFLKNRGLQYTHVNPAMERLFGATAPELIGRTDDELFGPEASQHIKAVDLRVVDGETVDEEDTKPVKGAPRTFHVVKAPIRDSSGFVSGLCGIARDITEKKHAERALRESEAKYKTIIENIEEGFYEVDLAGNMIFFNDSTCKILGFPRKELMGMNNREYMDDATYRNVFERFNAVYKTGRPDTAHGWKIVRKDKTQNSIEGSISLVRDSEGKPCGFRGIVRDVTERERLQTQLVQARKMQAIGTLAGGIAHDFNNILYAIIGFTELALDDVPEGSILRSNLSEVLLGATRARDLVKQILAFSSETQQEMRPVQIGPILKEIVKFLRASIPATTEIHEDITPDLGAVMADPTHIHQVIMNLSTNAAHAMGEKGGILELGLIGVELDSDSLERNQEIEPGSYLELRVSDTGHGIPKGIRERIFEPYFTTKETGEGTGLGLSVVHGIVKSHGGMIRMHSEPGKGSTFRVYWPRLQAEEQKNDRVSETVPGGHERILFVDDERAVVEMGRQMLKNLGYDVATRTSSLEALELFRAEPDRFDLVITDLDMPKMTGADFIKEIRTIRRNVPVILCTGFSELISEEEAWNLGIRAVLMKPILRNELAEAIRQAVDE